MNNVLDNKYPYLSNFFETAINENRLFHSVILYGSNNYIQYAMALELARQLNCLETGDLKGRENCECRNCRWIRENKHPAVMTISKIDNKSDKDTTKTVISVQQTEMVLDKIFGASDYHRVFIFCNADMKKPTEKEKEEYEEFKTTGFIAPQEDNGETIWYPSSINRKCFGEASANSMLKSIEEPSTGITFIFLTNNPNDLISTIVSRSQSFYVPYSRKSVYITDFFDKYFVNYPKFNPDIALVFAQNLLNYQTANNLEPSYIIDCIQFYLTEILKANNGNKLLVNKIFKDITKTEEAKKMLKAYVKETQIYEYLAFYFAGKTQF